MMGHFVREQYDDIKLLQGEAAYFVKQVLMYRRTYASLLQAPCALKMEAGDSPAVLAHTHQTVCHHVPEDSIVHSHHHENLKSHSTSSSCSFSDISTLCHFYSLSHHLSLFFSDLPIFCVFSHNQALPSRILFRPYHLLRFVTQ